MLSLSGGLYVLVDVKRYITEVIECIVHGRDVKLIGLLT